jgi:hypothetical protein
MSDVYARFKSLMYPAEFGYAFDSDAWSRNNNGGVNSKFRMYHTYGDGLTAHSPDWGITYEYLGDYLASLARYLLDNRPASLDADAEDLKEHERQTRELFRSISYIVMERPRQEVIEFAASVIWKESDDEYSKQRFYSIGEKKITKNREKQHDKRYHRIERSDDGSAQAVLRMVVPEYADGMERFCYAVAVKEWFDAQPNKWCESAARLIGWWNEDEDSHTKKAILRYGFDAIRAIANMYQGEQAARNSLSNYYHNHLRKAEEQKQLPAETEAA